MKFRIAICDDDAGFRERLVGFCQSYFKNDEIGIREYGNGGELLKEQEKFDILFLDIEMPGVDGIQVKDAFEEWQTGTDIIFITSHEEEMQEAFGRNVVAFWKKPLEEQDFFAAMDKKLKQKYICIEENQEVYRFLPRNIRYIVAVENYSKVICTDGERLLRVSIKTWETLLQEERFVRVNRSCILNLEYWERDKDFLILYPNLKIRLSRKNKKEIIERYKNYMRNKKGK